MRSRYNIILKHIIMEPVEMGSETFEQQKQQQNLSWLEKEGKKKGCSLQKTRTLTKEEIKTRLISKIKKQQKTTKTSKNCYCRKKFRQYLQEKLEKELNNQFSCLICLQLIINPAPTPCGHIFCFKCLEEALIHRPVCPMCRTQIRSNQFPISSNYEKINQCFWKHSSNSTEYHDRFTENSEWRKKRFINLEEMEIDQSIDVRDTEHVWCKATVKKIYYEDGKVNQILIHYKSWNKIYDEVINVKSQRLAPANFFSQRNDIPKYKLNQSDDNVRGRIRYANQGQEQNQFQLVLISQNNPFESQSSLFPHYYNPLRSFPRAFYQQANNFPYLSFNLSSLREDGGNGQRQRRFQNIEESDEIDFQILSDNESESVHEQNNEQSNNNRQGDDEVKSEDNRNDGQ